jgi:hypothetical protein
LAAKESGGIGGIVAVEHGLAGMVEDAQIHASGVEIAAAVESVRLVLETDHGSPWAWVRAPEPASSLHQRRPLRIIQRMQLTSLHCGFPSFEVVAAGPTPDPVRSAYGG